MGVGVPLGLAGTPALEERAALMATCPEPTLWVSGHQSPTQKHPPTPRRDPRAKRPSRPREEPTSDPQFHPSSVSPLPTWLPRRWEQSLSLPARPRPKGSGGSPSVQISPLDMRLLPGLLAA